MSLEPHTEKPKTVQEDEGETHYDTMEIQIEEVLLVSPCSRCSKKGVIPKNDSGSAILLEVGEPTVMFGMVTSLL